jgi:hypothetical protein
MPQKFENVIHELGIEEDAKTFLPLPAGSFRGRSGSAGIRNAPSSKQTFLRRLLQSEDGRPRRRFRAVKAEDKLYCEAHSTPAVANMTASTSAPGSLPSVPKCLKRLDACR